MEQYDNEREQEISQGSDDTPYEEWLQEWLARKNNKITGSETGNLSIRQQFAYGNMVALVSTFRGSYTITEKLASDLAKESLMLADALIKELNNSENEKGS